MAPKKYLDYGLKIGGQVSEHLNPAIGANRRHRLTRTLRGRRVQVSRRCAPVLEGRNIVMPLFDSLLKPFAKSLLPYGGHMLFFPCGRILFCNHFFAHCRLSSSLLTVLCLFYPIPPEGNWSPQC